jgi:hypothetical protein
MKHQPLGNAPSVDMRGYKFNNSRSIYLHPDPALGGNPSVDERGFKTHWYYYIFHAPLSLFWAAMPRSACDDFENACISHFSMRRYHVMGGNSSVHMRRV